MSERRETSFNERRIDEIFRAYQAFDAPGVVVGIAHRGHVVYRKAFGLASLELPTRLSPTVRMRIGSISKQFTCLSYLLLCEKGMTSLESPLGRHLPELEEASKQITFRQLMGHVSGLYDSHDIFWHVNGVKHGASTDDHLLLYRTRSLAYRPPGCAWSYNNGAYVLLSAAIERIADKPLEEVLREYIFAELGMSSTQLCRHDCEAVANSASAYISNEQNGRYRKSYLGGAITGEGGLFSNVDDLLVWLANMERPSIGSVSSWKEMKTPLKLNLGNSTDYGLGLFVNQYRGLKIIHHSGGVLGWKAQLLKAPEARVDVAILANRSDSEPVLSGFRILDECLLQSQEPSLELAQVSSGTFRSEQSGRVIQLFQNAGRQMVCVDGADFELSLESDGVLRPSRGAEWLKWYFRPQGDWARPDALLFEDNGCLDELTRQAAPENPSAGEIIGRYWCSLVGADARVFSGQGEVSIVLTGQLGATRYDLEWLSNRILRARIPGYQDFGAILTFGRQPVGFQFSTLRSPQLRFVRE